MSCGKRVKQIQQGDQYAIPILLTVKGDFVTPEIADDVIIQIGNASKTYSSGEVTFNSETNMYEYPITAEESWALQGVVEYQAGIDFGGDIVYTPTGILNVKNTMIEKGWGE